MGLLLPAIYTISSFVHLFNYVTSTLRNKAAQYRLMPHIYKSVIYHGFKLISLPCMRYHSFPVTLLSKIHIELVKIK